MRQTSKYRVQVKSHSFIYLWLPGLLRTRVVTEYNELHVRTIVRDGGGGGDGSSSGGGRRGSGGCGDGSSSSGGGGSRGGRGGDGSGGSSSVVVGYVYWSLLDKSMRIHG
jgi:hypothetical protein